MNKQTIPVDAELVGRCGLYCGACKSYLRGKCKGCSVNVKATWCAVRPCCGERKIATCADCADFPDPRACGKYNNILSRILGLLLWSDRPACIAQIKRLGLAGHAKAMAASGRYSIRR